jgi:RNA polymerase sigma factor (sigma-70 family)
MEAGLPRADEALMEDVAASARGSVDAYRRLVERSRNLVCSIALAAVRDVAESEEIAQEVYLAAWKGLRALRNPNSFLPWLRQLTRNECADHLKRRSRSRWVQGDEAELVLATAADGAPSLEQAFELQERLRALSEALDELPDETRETVVLFYREGHSVAQVASLLGLTEDTVKQRLSWARVRLRQSLLEKFGEAAATTAPGAAFALGVVSLIDVGSSGTATAANAGVARSVWAGVEAAKYVLLIGVPVLLVVGALGSNWFAPAAAADRSGSSATARAAPRGSATPEPPAPRLASLGGADAGADPLRRAQASDRGRGQSFVTAPLTGSGLPSSAYSDAIRAAIRAVSPQIRACYESALKTDPALAGKVTVRLRLESGDGGAFVAEGDVVETEAHSPLFESCLLAKVAGAAFPNPEGGGAVTVTYPFNFDPGGGFGGTTPQ